MISYSVARHVGHMSFPAPPPALVQHNYYTIHNNQYAPNNSEYDRELAYMNAPNDGGSSRYWQQTRKDAMGFIGAQAGP